MISLLTLASVLSLTATEVQRLPADATQGVVSDGRAVYAISNHSIGKIDPATGREVARWDGDPAHFKHMNSCIVDRGTIVCAASNYPEVPMASMIERFDSARMVHLGTQPLPPGHGSLTWVVPHDGAWWACFANYDGRGGEPARDHRFTTLVRYDKQWRETGSWRFPDSVLERMTPSSSSGGDWGKDGLLYVTGHDRPELYALRVPKTGGVLEHVATIAIPTGGQAIGWDPVRPRLLWTIERKTTELVASQVPPVTSGAAP